MIQLEHLYKSYQTGDVVLPVLRDINLEIQAGEFVSIMGASGSGKTTLLNVIGCLDRFDKGQYRLHGNDISLAMSQTKEDELARIRREHIGFIFQQFNLIPRLTATRNIELPLMYTDLPRKERKARILQALDRVGLSDRADHTPAQLSGGQQQRIAIARALINQPEILIADEPTGSLDTQTGQEIMRLFTSLNEEGTTIVMVTHEEEIAEYSQRVIRLKDGEILVE